MREFPTREAHAPRKLLNKIARRIAGIIVAKRFLNILNTIDTVKQQLIQRRDPNEEIVI
jgi:hypothetical protein